MCCKLHVLQIAHVANGKGCKLHVFQIACVANCMCYKLHVLQIGVANCMCCKLHALQSSNVAKLQICQVDKLPSYQGANLQRCKCAKMERCKGAKVQRFKGATAILASLELARIHIMASKEEVRKEAWGIILRTGQAHFPEGVKEMAETEVQGIQTTNLRLASHTARSLYGTKYIPILGRKDPLKEKVMRKAHLAGPQA